MSTRTIVRAAHLDVVKNLTAKACLEATRSIVALYGISAKLISNNALIPRQESH